MGACLVFCDVYFSSLTVGESQVFGDTPRIRHHSISAANNTTDIGNLQHPMKVLLVINV